VLDRAEALRAKRRAALSQLDTLTRSIFLDLFGDPVRNERVWPVATVDDLCDLVRGSSPRPQGDPRFFGGPVPRLMVADITRDGILVTPRIDSLTLEGAKRSRPVPAGTVVMAVSGNIGLVSRLAIDACVHDGFVAFTHLDEAKVEPDFLLALLDLSKSAHDQHKAGAIFINLTTTDIKAMHLPVPPLALQREFIRRLSSIAKLKAAHHTSLAELDALFAVLQHRAFRGEL
jgi:type I restriction enzyme, S subunit